MFEYLRKLKNKGFNPSKILDIGAWNGIWTRSTKEIWPNAKYTCIEAGEKHRRRLRLCANKVYIKVLGNKSKEVKMHLRQIRKGPERTKVTFTKGSNIFGSAGNFPAYAHQTRQMVTLGSVVGKDAQYDLIKQDVQGAELLVMQGSPKIFRRAKYVIQEVNLYKDKDFPEIPDEKEMDKYMEQLGFNNNEVIGNHEGFNQIDKIYY